MPKTTCPSGPTGEEIAKLCDRHEARFRHATRNGFDGGEVAKALGETEDEAVRLGVDFDRFLLQDMRATIAAAHASHETHNERVKQLEDRTPAEQHPVLRAKLKHIGRERGYRTQLVTVRDLHADPTGTKVRYFLGAVPSVIRSHRPVAAARARRPRRSSSSSSTSGADPPGDDPPSDSDEAERRALVPAYERLRRLTSQAASDGGGKTRAPAFSDGPRLEELAHLFGAVGGRIWAEVREQSDERLERYFRGECS